MILDPDLDFAGESLEALGSGALTSCGGGGLRWSDEFRDNICTEEGETME